MARRVFLHRQCQEIQVDVESMLANKTTFLGDLVKSLSKVTGEWRAWKHEIFGGVRTKVYVASIAQVKKLNSSEKKTKPANLTLISLR